MSQAPFQVLENSGVDRAESWPYCPLPSGEDGQSAGKTHNVGGDDGYKGKQSLIRGERDRKDCLPRWLRRASLVREHGAEAHRK